MRHAPHCAPHCAAHRAACARTRPDANRSADRLAPPSALKIAAFLAARLAACLAAWLAVAAPDSRVAAAEGDGEETLACAPALPFYCANIHIGCAGRSRLATAPFIIRIRGEDADLDRPGGAARRLVTREATKLILRPASGGDWIVVDRQGEDRDRPTRRYVERIYSSGGALMAFGTCAAPRSAR